MQRTNVLGAALGVPVLIAAGMTGCVANDDVTLDETPEPVHQTIQANLRGGQIQDLERSTDDGVVTYEVEVERGANEWEFLVGEDGEYLGIEDGNPPPEDASSSAPQP